MSDESGKCGGDTDRAKFRPVRCKQEEDCDNRAELWATWPDDRELAEDGTPVCEKHYQELGQSDESVLFTSMTAPERYVEPGSGQNGGER